MSTRSKRDVASGRARSRKSSTSRTRCTQESGAGESGTYAVATLARSNHCSPCPCPAVCDGRVQSMSQQTPKKLRDSVSVTEHGRERVLFIGTQFSILYTTHVQRVAEVYKIARTQGVDKTFLPLTR